MPKNKKYKGTVLLVEDEISRVYLEESLEKAGYLVVSFEKGREVVEYIEGGFRYNVAIIDRCLSDISGDDIMKLSKRINPQAKVFNLSSYPDNVRYADGNFFKPVSTREMINTLDRILT